VNGAEPASPFVFHIFIGVICLKAAMCAQMNTNCDMLPFSLPLVHTRNGYEHDTNAQNFSKMLPLWAK
jgi:hypothetical protein